MKVGPAITTMNHCMYGLKGPDGSRLQKPAICFASSKHLLKSLNPRCNRQHKHGHIMGPMKAPNGEWNIVSTWAQAWPPALCSSIAKGTNSVALNLLAHFPQGINLFLMGSPMLHPVHDLRQPWCTFSAWSTLSA